MNKPKRTGDWNFHPIKEIPQGLEEVKHNNRFIYGVGEASNHMHIISAPKKTDFKIFKDTFGNYYYHIIEDATLTHELGTSGKTADHEPIVLGKGFYKQIQERELDLFSKVARKVID